MSNSPRETIQARRYRYLFRTGGDTIHVDHKYLRIVNPANIVAAITIGTYFEDLESHIDIDIKVEARRCLHLQSEQLKGLDGHAVSVELPYSIALCSKSRLVVVSTSRPSGFALMSVVGTPRPEEGGT